MWSKALLGLLIGRIATTLIASTMAVAIGWHLYEATGDAFDLALVGLFQIVPIISLSIFAGWVADHYSRKLILLLTSLLQLAVIFAVAMIMSQPELNKWYLFICLSFLGVGRAFFSPAIQSVLPNVVPPDQLNRAVALISSVWNLALTIGPFLAGILVALVDVKLYWLLLILGVFTLTGFSLLPSIKVTEKRSLNFSELLGGIHYLRKNRTVLGAISIDLAIVLAGSVMAILPMFVKDVLHAGPEVLGLLRAMPAVGATLIGTLITGRQRAFQHNGRVLFTALTIFAFSIIMFAFSHSVWMACIALLIYGGSDMFSVVIRSSVVQLLTPDNLRGRVSALNSLFISCSNDLGDFRAGSMGALLGPIYGALLGGVMALGVVAGSAYMFRSLRNLGEITPVEKSERRYK